MQRFGRFGELRGGAADFAALSSFEKCRGNPPHFIKCGREGWGEFYDLQEVDFTIFRLTVLRIYGIIRGIFWRYYAV